MENDMATSAPKPFDNNAFSVRDLNIESAEDQVSLYGNLTLTRDQAGLAAATQLRDYLSQLVTDLEVLDQKGHLPARLTLIPPVKKANPLG